MRFSSSSLHFLDLINGSSSGLILGSFHMQCHPDRQIISGSVIRKNVRTCSSESLTASFANKMFTYSVNGVNKILLTLGPMAIAESDMSLMGLNILVQVLLA